MATRSTRIKHAKAPSDGRAPTGQALAVPVEPASSLAPSGFDPSRGIAKQIERALYECAGKASPAEIRIGYEAWDALRADPDAWRWMNGAPWVFQSVPVRPLPPRDMPLTHWEVVPGRCEYCRGTGRVMTPILPTATVNEVVSTDFGSKECPDCHGKPLSSIGPAAIAQEGNA